LVDLQITNLRYSRIQFCATPSGRGYRLQILQVCELRMGGDKDITLHDVAQLPTGHHRGDGSVFLDVVDFDLGHQLSCAADQKLRDSNVKRPLEEEGRLTQVSGQPVVGVAGWR
jgi:hypothetical protein